MASFGTTSSKTGSCVFSLTREEIPTLQERGPRIPRSDRGPGNEPRQALREPEDDPRMASSGQAYDEHLSELPTRYKNLLSPDRDRRRHAVGSEREKGNLEMDKLMVWSMGVDDGLGMRRR